jgi:hypothetical protein
MAQQGMTEVARANNLRAATEKLRVDKMITQAEYDAMKATNFVGVTAREVRVLSDVASDWVDKFLPKKLIETITRSGNTTTRERRSN